MLIHDFTLREIEWTPQEEASSTELVKETLRRAKAGPAARALTFLTAALGFDNFVIGMGANDRRPDSQTCAYVITNQSKDWLSKYDERSYLEIDPRIDLAAEPGCFYWEAAQFQDNTSYRVFLTQAAGYGIRSGLVVGLCTRNSPSYTMFALNCVAPTLPWNVRERMEISGQALLLLEVFDLPVSFHRCLVPISGGVTAALMLSPAIWTTQALERASGGWFTRLQEQWSEETGLSRWEQKTALRVLRNAGFLEEQRIGMPAKLWFRVRPDAVWRALQAHAASVAR